MPDEPPHVATGLPRLIVEPPASTSAVANPVLPETGAASGVVLLWAFLLCGAGTAALAMTIRRRA